MSDLDDWVKPFVMRQDRVLAAESRSEKDAFFRSDHLSFARAGVPVLFMRGGTLARAGSDPSATWNAYGKLYHTPADAFDPHWDLRGIVQDLEVSCAVGRKLASGHEWPNWHDGSARARARARRRSDARTVAAMPAGARRRVRGGPADVAHSGGRANDRDAACVIRGCAACKPVGFAPPDVGHQRRPETREAWPMSSIRNSDTCARDAATARSWLSL